MKNIKNIIKGALVVGFLFGVVGYSYANEAAADAVQEGQAVHQIELPEQVEVKSKDVKTVAGIWRRIAKKINAQYRDEYPEVAQFTAKMDKLRKRCVDQDMVVIADEKAKRLVSAWEDIELLLLASPRSDERMTRDGKKTIPSLDAYDLAKVRGFVARVKECLHDVTLYRACIGNISNKINIIINTLGDCGTSEADPLDCTYPDVTTLMADINVLCPIVTLLRTILAELRGVGPGPAFCP